jgi:hypothetical protein
MGKIIAKISSHWETHFFFFKLAENNQPKEQQIVFFPLDIYFISIFFLTKHKNTYKNGESLLVQPLFVSFEIIII